MTASLPIEQTLQSATPGKACAPDVPIRRCGRRNTTDAMVRDAINAHVGHRVSAIRRSRGVTQAALGEVLGLSNQQVQKYEKGANGFNLERVWQIARYFDIEIADLLDGMEAAALGMATPGPQITGHRLRLAVAQAVRRAESTKLLRGVLQLLRATEPDPPPDEDDDDVAG